LHVSTKGLRAANSIIHDIVVLKYVTHVTNCESRQRFYITMQVSQSALTNVSKTIQKSASQCTVK